MDQEREHKNLINPSDLRFNDQKQKHCRGVGGGSLILIPVLLIEIKNHLPYFPSRLGFHTQIYDVMKSCPV